MQYALDSEYKARWEEYHLDSGIIMDSRNVNWRNVEWERIVKLVVVIRDQRFVVTNSDPNFKAFVRWRVAGKVNGKPWHSWVVGWTDGNVCYVNEFDFKTGELIKQNQVVSLERVKAHVHRRVRDRLGLRQVLHQG